MTKPQLDLTQEEILERRLTEGYLDIGYHYVVTRCGRVHKCIPEHEAGTHTPRYNHQSLGILIVGGQSRKGTPSANYTKPQMTSLERLLTELAERFPNATPTGYGQLCGGVNPCLNLKDITNG